MSFDDGPGSRPDQDQLLTNALDRVRKMPGVDAATVFSALPFRAIHRPPISVPGVGEPRLDGQLPNLIESTPESFDILQIEIVEGRGLAPHDDRGAPVVVVSETMARAVWPGGRAIGKCIRIGWGVSAGLPAPPASAPCREVVGIARDWRREPRPGAPRYMHYYVPIAQSLQLPPWMVPGAIAEGLLIRKRADIDLPAEEIRAAVTGGRTDLPFVDVQPYAANEGPRLQHWVIGTQLLLLFGALALATAAMGMYAAFAHSVAERRQEIAVRLAVGASRQRVLVMMLRRGNGDRGAGRDQRRGCCDACRMGGAIHDRWSLEPGSARERRGDGDCADRCHRRDMVSRLDRLEGGAEYAVANGLRGGRDSHCLARAKRCAD